jgi:hypothetical protein
LTVARRRVAVLVAAVLVAAVACTTQVDGRGARAGLVNPSPSASRPDFPSPSSSAPSTPSGSASPSPSRTAVVTGCPHAVDPRAGLRYTCISAGLQPDGSPVWTLELSKQVDRDWYLSEGSGVLPAGQTASLRTFSERISAGLVSTDYGTDPTSTVDSGGSLTIDGHAAWVVQTTITLNPTFVASTKLKVKRERLWVAVINAETGRDAVWFVTIPDLLANLWPTVPAVINSIQVD